MDDVAVRAAGRLAVADDVGGVDVERLLVAELVGGTWPGGLQGVVSEFERNGFGPTVQSWVGTGPNQAIAPDGINRVLGNDLLQQLAAKTGLSVQDLTQKLAQILPDAVDKLTPDGVLPK